MRKLLTLIILAVVGMFGCTSNGELTLNGVTDSELEAVKKLRSGQYTLVSNQELTQLKHDAELGKGVGRYQIYRQGFRTWRLDTASGAVCLLLTTEQDWKKPEITAESCGPLP